MARVRINGRDSDVRGDNLPKMADLVELIKTMIDPDHMIIGLLVDGHELEDQDWGSSMVKFQTSVIEVQTDLPCKYLENRLHEAPLILSNAYMMFRNARKAFQTGNMYDGNKSLSGAVHSLQAFFQWYGTILDLIPEGDRANFSITKQVEVISETCKKICQQQLYQSWWALGQTIQEELEPEIDKLEDYIRKFKYQPRGALN